MQPSTQKYASHVYPPLSISAHAPAGPPGAIVSYIFAQFSSSLTGAGAGAGTGAGAGAGAGPVPVLADELPIYSMHIMSRADATRGKVICLTSFFAKLARFVTKARIYGSGLSELKALVCK
jgi:hypothetical protein